MTQILSVEEILLLLKGTDVVLRMLQAQSEYRNIETTEEFNSSNDFNLLDVINTLGEVVEAIERFQSAQNPEGNGL
ncbi:hypothetical protein [Nostoc sp. FACHB-110]|uniref:hypothetical protein n=1 Tax=Nostoc sp. FACHB-110 TaxID=2692834 RepID=UPI001684629D|nr:hypothetical protein [Nostoc sp. FACHB-110]MBD2438808.1 hypothetical protein [Nostoc sp. FACHB-110]